MDYKQADLQRKSDPTFARAAHIRSSVRWQRLRPMFLRRHALCNDPYGVHAKEKRVVPALEVDHIIGIAFRPDLAFTETNLQALCKQCHGRKSAHERRKTEVHTHDLA
jgi:5-methylcytosine-specific restriction protein A